MSEDLLVSHYLSNNSIASLKKGAARLDCAKSISSA